MKKITYQSSGVDIQKADRFIETISPWVKQTKIRGVVGGIGGFAGLFSPRLKGLKSPVLVASTDGVGTKLKLAVQSNHSNTIGIDLVAMTVNDILAVGAPTLFFLDYFATSKLNRRQAQGVIKGIVKGCKMAGCALLGGETAEMPGLYQKADYDLAGFGVGIVEKSKLTDGKRICSGDILLGLPSSGIHSNGYSLVRKLFPHPPRKLLAAFLKPTRIYVPVVLPLLKRADVRGMVHITGGGLTENIPRVLPKRLAAHIDLKAWKRPKIFSMLQQKGNIEEREMLKTFNCGIGFVLIVAKRDALKLYRHLKQKGEKPVWMGEIKPSKTTCVIYT